MTEEPREQTSDWIMESYIKDDPTYGCTHPAWMWEGEWLCVLCGKSMVLIITPEEHEWLLSLCSGRQG